MATGKAQASRSSVRRVGRAPIWRPNDIEEAAQAAGLVSRSVSLTPDGASPQPAEEAAAKPKLNARDIGARAIYEFRSHPKKKRWGQTSEDEKEIYLQRMDSLIRVLDEAGYILRR